MWTSELKGRAVVSLGDAKKVGSVADVMFHPETGEIAGFVVNVGGLGNVLHGALGEKRMVSMDGVRAVGQDAVTIVDQAALMRPNSAPQLQHLPSVDRVIGLRVVTAGGQLLGEVSDVSLDPETKRVVNFRVRSSAGSPLQGFTRGSQHEVVIPFSSEIHIGPDLMVVPDSALARPRVDENPEEGPGRMSA